METPCFYVLYRVEAQVGPGPGGAGWMAGHISGQFLLRWQFPLLPPGPQVWGSGLARPPSAGVRHRQGRKQENGAPPQQRPKREEPLSLLVWCSPIGPAWEATPHSTGKRGGFHKEGEGPSFGDSFVSFSSLRKRPQRSVSASLTGLCRRIVRGAAPLSFNPTILHSSCFIFHFISASSTPPPPARRSGCCRGWRRGP